VSAGDRFEHFKPPYKVVEQQLAAPRGSITIAAARLEDEGRTLALSTDPQPWDATYALVLPKIGAPGSKPVHDADLAFDLRGVSATWENEHGRAEPTDWWPHLDLSVMQRLTTGSPPHERSFARLNNSGVLVLRTALRLPPGKFFLKVNAQGTLTLKDATIDGETAELSQDRSRVLLSSEIIDAPAMLELVFKTGQTGRGPALLEATFHTQDDPTERPLRLEQLGLPWAPAASPPASPTPAAPPQLAGGDAGRGALVFTSEEAKCATCHVFRGQGKAVGPDLSNLHERDVASVFREISEPSATINPDYVPYTVALKDGRVLAGIVRAEGEHALRVTDTNAQVTIVNRSEIDELRPSATSIMPVGLAGVLGEQKLRDLVLFLTTPPEKK
jgi:putative heme-binding domain-containing protein